MQDEHMSDEYDIRYIESSIKSAIKDAVQEARLGVRQDGRNGPRTLAVKEYAEIVMRAANAVAARLKKNQL